MSHFRPGSETTTLTVGDPVRCNRAEPPKGTWKLYDGREGWVATINHYTTLGGRNHVEIGVSWTRPTDNRNPAADAWFRNDELVPR